MNFRKKLRKTILKNIDKIICVPDFFFHLSNPIFRLTLNTHSRTQKTGRTMLILYIATAAFIIGGGFIIATNLTSQKSKR